MADREFSGQSAVEMSASTDEVLPRWQARAIRDIMLSSSSDAVTMRVLGPVIVISSDVDEETQRIPPSCAVLSVRLR